MPDRPFQNPSHEPQSFGTTGAEIRYVVLGDSTAAGQGGNYENGIAVGTARELARARHVKMTNFAVSGARARDVIDVQLTEAERLHPDVVLVAVGANDVTHLTPVASVHASLLEIVRRLRTANPEVAIVLTGYPDMGTPPRIPLLLRPLAGWRARSLNSMVEALARDEKVTFAPIARVTGPFFKRDRTLFAADRFHPNDRGYATWIEVLNQALGLARISHRNL